MNILFCSVGRRYRLLKNFRQSMGDNGKIIATDVNENAPALYAADSHYIVPSINDSLYLDYILNICKKENIKAITTCIDPEIMILAENREKFEEMGIVVLTPYYDTAKICFDKYDMFLYMRDNGINTVNTYNDFYEFKEDYDNNKIDFPVFVKPRTGSGSVGARKINDIVDLENVCKNDNSLIIQEYMGNALDIDVDIYIDTVSKETVSLFSKKKLSTKIGGADKTISFIDDKLVKFVVESNKKFKFNGPIDMDLWYKNGKYFLSEVNPRFGGAYLHAYGAGVDFIKLIENNVNGKENKAEFNNYKEGVVMMMYDDVVIRENC